MPARLLREIGFLVAVVTIAFTVRVLLASIYLIPPDSMLPGLLPGDYVAVEKWPYGWSRRALPPGLSGPGRIAAGLPRRGDVVVFHGPPDGKRTYVKRLIGLPGDHVALHHGIVILNGRPVPRWRVADLVVPVSPSTPCVPAAYALIRIEAAPDGARACRYPRFREMLPGGRSYALLDLGYGAGDDFGPATVPAGHAFMLGDNRDRSADSRFPPRDGVGIGMIPLDALIGRAGPLIFSTDGSATPLDPASWWRAMRARRIGQEP